MEGRGLSPLLFALAAPDELGKNRNVAAANRWRKP